MLYYADYYDIYVGSHSSSTSSSSLFSFTSIHCTSIYCILFSLLLPAHPSTFPPSSDAMDSPAVPAPLDPHEQPILDKLLRTRDALLLIKQDKSSYIKSRDVLPLYEEVIAEVEKLNAVRKQQDRRLEYNRR